MLCFSLIVDAVCVELELAVSAQSSPQSAARPPLRWPRAPPLAVPCRLSQQGGTRAAELRAGHLRHPQGSQNDQATLSWEHESPLWP